jgi:acyl-CoA thioester hydrolase
MPAIPMTQAAGRFEGKTHILPVRIYYADTDLSGIVYHANYLAYMERGRSEFFRSVGIARLAQLESAEPTAWTLRKVALEYLKPARIDDLIEVHTKLTGLTGARMNAEQDVHLNGAMLTRASIEACIITLTGKPRRIPQEVRDKLSPFLYETTA